MSLYDRVVLTEAKKLSKTEQRIMDEIAKRGEFVHEAGSERRSMNIWTKSYPFGLRVETAIKKLKARGLVTFELDATGHGGAASRIYRVTAKEKA